MTATALITGVTGFIGGRLAERLLALGWRVEAVVRSGSSAAPPARVGAHDYDGTLDSLVRAVEATRPDVVFHLASLYLAEHRPDQVDALLTSNVTLPAQLAEAMTATGAGRLVNTGTAWQHYRTAGYNPVNLYAATKQAAEDLLRFHHDARGLSVVTLRLFDTFGVGDTRRKLAQLLVEAARTGATLDMSPGEQVVDLTHVDDVVSAFVAAADHLRSAAEPCFDSYFVSGDRMTVRELADRVGRAIGRPVHARFGGRPYRAREVMLPPDPAGALPPGWRRERALDDGLRELAAIMEMEAGDG